MELMVPMLAVKEVMVDAILAVAAVGDLIRDPVGMVDQES
jgi:hypothetical protein